jgi:putative peptide zinc metalloprotease protein
VRLTGELNVARTRVNSLRARLTTDPEAAAQLEIAEEMLVDVERQLQQRQKDERALTLVTPAGGVVMEPPEVPAPPSTEQRLPAWTGTPLDTKNARCYLERGTLLCLVGDPAHKEAVVFIDETDVQFVRLRQRVRMHFDVAPASILTGEITEIAKRNIVTVPQELAVDQELANRTDATGSRRPVRTSYSVRVKLDEQAGAPLLTAARGQAKILVEPQSLAERLLRSFRKTFTVDL